MVRAASTSDLVLRRIVQTIAERFRPRRILLFGSRARGDATPDSDYDIMVELDAVGDRHERVREISAALRERSFALDIIVRAPGQMDRRRDDPGTLEYDIAREGIVIYRRSDVGLRAVPMRIRERPIHPPDSVMAWIDRAQEDLRIMEIVLQSEVVPWSGVCFHAQQAAEKYLKALLIQEWMPPPRVHDLAELVDAAVLAGYALPDLGAPCEALAPFAVEVRYPDDVVLPTAAAGRAAVAAVTRIVAVVSPLLRVEVPI